MIQEKLKRHRRRKRILYGTLAVTVLTCTVTAFLFFNTYLTTFSVYGTQYLTSEFVQSRMFETQMDRRYYYVKGRELFSGPRTLPMIESYVLSFQGTGHVDIVIEEKKPVGGVLFAEGAYLYFDDEGYILCTKNEILPGVPVIEGINAISPKMYEKIHIDQEELMDDIMMLTGLLEEYDMKADSLIYDEEHKVTLKMENVRVSLGTRDEMEGKIAELYDMQEGLEGLRGILHLENYDSFNRNANYIFERD